MKEESWHKGTTKTGGDIVFPGQCPQVTVEQLNNYGNKYPTDGGDKEGEEGE